MRPSYQKDRNRLAWVVNISVVILVVLWIIPTLGLLVTSFREKDQITQSGWWQSLKYNERTLVVRAESGKTEELIDGRYVVSGSVFEEGGEGATILSFGIRQNQVDIYKPGDTAVFKETMRIQLKSDGSYEWSSEESLAKERPPRIFFTAVVPPHFSLENYHNVLFETEEGEIVRDEAGDVTWSRQIAQGFVNSLTVAIPSTIIPILIAAFCAYALAWMRFPARAILIAVIVGLLVVPLQISLIPVLRMHKIWFSDIMGGDPKGYLQIWMAHTGFGLPLAIYLLRNYMAGLPREIIESARIDGANDFNIFVRIILPLSLPALASFAIFQFLWTWNDFLVASIFMERSEDQKVLTIALRDLLGSRGGDWDVLSASAFVSIIVPVCVFFLMQKYLVRGLLSGSVK